MTTKVRAIVEKKDNLDSIQIFKNSATNYTTEKVENNPKNWRMYLQIIYLMSDW